MLKKYLIKFFYMNKNYKHKISVAPMMDITNTYFRYLMRLLTKHSVLYT